MIEIIDMTAPAARLVDAEQASARLGVSRQTLYSYVSRGLIRAVPVLGDTRRSLYDARDIAGLIEKRNRGRARRAVASSTTDWGEPILRSSLTRIADGTFQYRGRDAVALSDTATLEEVAALLWDEPVPFVPLAPSGRAGPNPFKRCLRAVADGAAHSDWGTQRAHVAAVAARLLGVVARAACGAAGHGGAGGALHTRMAAAWGIGTAGADLIRRALVLCADHELNAPDGDPRCAALLSAFPPNPPWLGMIEAAARLTAKRPIVDVALAALEAT